MKNSSVNLMLIAFVFVLFHGCCEPCNDTETKLDCLSDNTKIELSLSELSLNCLDGQNCFSVLENKYDYIIHKPNKVTNPPLPSFPDTALDPAVTNIMYVSGPHIPAYDCQEPPKNFNGGGNRSLESATQLDSTDETQTGPLVIGENEIVFLRTCEDKETENEVSAQSDKRTFLSISVFPFDYTELENTYKEIYDAPSPGNIVFHQNFAFIRNLNAFTVENKIPEPYYVTIVKANKPGWVIRIAYRKKDRMEKNVIFKP